MAVEAGVVEDSVKFALGSGYKRIMGATVYAGRAQKDPLALNDSCTRVMTRKLRASRIGVAVGEMDSLSSRAPRLTP